MPDRDAPGAARTRFPGISSRAYEHPADRSALVAMRSLAGFDSVLRRLGGVVREPRLRLLFLATAVRAGEHQFAELHATVTEAAGVLDLPEVPEVYVVRDPAARAMTLGVERPFLVVTSGLLDLMDAEELCFVVGHEVGHILSGHAVYGTMLYQLGRLTAAAVWLPLGYWGLRGIESALAEWQRKAELSCDRAGLLVGQDPEAALRALMKLAGGSRAHPMDVEAFLAQAADYEAAGEARDGVLKLLNLLGETSPFAVPRAAELRRWVEAEYPAVLAGRYPRRADDAQASVTDEFRTTARAYGRSVRRTADPLFSMVRDLATDAADASEKLFTRWAGGPGR
jgi:Zn-dependent protease with chaperone function